MDSFLTYLGLARRAGCLETGEENTGLCVRMGRVRLILLASDASENAVRRAESFAKTGAGIPVVTVPREKAELSAATGRPGCSMVAVTNIGFAAGIVRRLSETEPDKYEALALELTRKRDKATRRKREAMARDLAKKVKRFQRPEPNQNERKRRDTP